MKTLVDMCLTPRWIEVFRRVEMSATHWSSIGRANTRDIEIMRFAADHEYVVLTHDLDFGAILAVTKGGRPSVVQLRAQDINPDVIGLRVISALRQAESELEAGALLTIDTDRMRLRLLPL